MKTHSALHAKARSALLNLRVGTPITLAKMERDKKVSIQYLTPVQRQHYQLEIKEGDFSFGSAQPLNKNHYFLFTLNKGNFYGKLGFEWKNYGNGFFGHGSFFAGGYVNAAGEMLIADGKLKYLTSNSGHYLPTLKNMRLALFQLYKKGVDLSIVTVVIYKHTRSSSPSRGRYLDADFYNGLELLQKHENECVKLNDRKNEFKNEINAIREATNVEIAKTDSLENLKPHRLNL